MDVKDLQQAIILIVDDNLETLGALCEYLRLCGFTVVVTESGEGALEMVVQSPPDIIVLDIMMPGINGFEVCRWLKNNAAAADIPVIFMSALSETVDKVKGFDAGGVDYITKPFQHEEVVARIAAHLRLRKLQQDLRKNNARLHQEIAQRMEAEQYARNIIASSLDMIITVDQDRRIVEFNRAAEDTFGYRRAEIVGQNIEILYADPAESSLTHQAMLVEQQALREVLNRRRNGEVFPCLLGASTLRDTHGAIIGYMGISRDITELKQAQAKLLAAHQELQEKNGQLQELNASKDKFFSIISHDLRGSFGTLLGFAQLVTENFEHYSQDKIKAFAVKMRVSAEKLYALLENLLTWSKIQRGAMERAPRRIDLHDIAQENLDLFASQAEHKQITLSSGIPQGTAAYADQSMVTTVLRNLISNALKFTAPGGRVSVAATECDEHFLAVAVADTGVGIPAEELLKLFRIDTHYKHVGTAGEQGTGLGLILCKELVEKNGGRVAVASAIDQGTTFTFTLPRQPLE